MAVWYWTGDGYSRARMARHDLGLPVVLCAPGPSMYPIARQPGLVIAALTKAYPVIKPDIWFGLDTPECYDRRLWHESFMKICRTGGLQDLQLHGRYIREFPNTFFADCREMEIKHIFRDRGHDVKLGWFKHTLGAALHGLVWMGARTIYLNGFTLGDLGGRDYAVGVEKTLTSTLRRSNQLLFDKQIRFLEEFARYANLNGIQVISSTPVSPINAFLPSVPLDEVEARAAKSVPEAGTLFHSRESELIRNWKNKPPKPAQHIASMKLQAIHMTPEQLRALSAGLSQAIGGGERLTNPADLLPDTEAGPAPLPLTPAGIKMAIERRKQNLAA
jgi:hypothetical protein